METKSTLYNEFPFFLKRYFPYKVQKISLNAGFTCPNRDGNKGVGGCTYCNNQTFNPDYCRTEKSITRQLEEGKQFFAHKYPEMKYLAYFQAYTNTYGELEDLKRKYEEALSADGVVGLVIGTRPDCMPDSLLDYLEEMNRHTFLLVEYGIESTDDKTLCRINRGHTFHAAADAVERTASRGILTGGHVILGLPGETHENIVAQAGVLSAHYPEDASAATDKGHPHGSGVSAASRRLPSVRCGGIYRPRDRLYRASAAELGTGAFRFPVSQGTTHCTRLGTKKL